MTSVSLDKSLDDIIASRPKSGRRSSSRKTGKAQVVGTSAAQAARARYSAPLPATNGAVAQATSAQQQPAEKIIVSNLPIDVNEAQIKELFASTVGPLREVNLHFDNAGRSKGVASVHFSRKGDGTKAFNQYNNRLIDGKRPMRIEIVLDPSRPVSQALLARVGPPPAAAAASASAPMEGVQAASTRGRPGRRGVRGRGRGKKTGERPTKSAADLDAEMEDYTAQPTTAAPAAATTA